MSDEVTLPQKSMSEELDQLQEDLKKLSESGASMALLVKRVFEPIETTPQHQPNK